MIKEIAYEILDTVKNIYQKQEHDKPNTIFKDKIFIKEIIYIERYYKKIDSSYYFET